MVDKLVQRGFKLRNAAHLAHWTATGEGSFARHEALGEFYEELITQLDKYVEAHQGAFGIALDKPAEDVVDTMRKDMLWITEHRGEISRGVPALENILDELAGLHMRTLYKLENLR
jgi:DNA-binding ferritin-like protein